MTTTATGRLLSPSEVAERLGVSRQTIYRMCHHGRLPACKLGRHSAGLRIRERDLERWLWEGNDAED